MNKVFVLGLDGATFDLLKPLMDGGRMPFLRECMQNGMHGDLESVIPPYTAPAWAAFSTGKSPANNGVFDFISKDSSSRTGFSYCNRTSIKSKTIWEILSENNKKVALVNLPLTYPPEKINGYMVTGLMTPQGAAYTYPEGLREELEEACGEYLITERNLYTRHYDDLIKELRYVIKQREKAVLWMLKQKEWDLFISIFTSTDVIQHQLWKYLDPTHHEYDAKKAASLKEGFESFYSELDGIARNIFNNLDDKTNFIIVSDHGFGTLHRFIFINNILMEKGLLAFKRTIPVFIKKVLFSLGLTPLNVYRVLHRLNMGGVKNRRDRQGVYDKMKKIFLSMDDVDWKMTKAYAFGNFGQIYLNLKGRESAGIVNREEYVKVRDSIKEMLKDYKDPESGRNLFGDVFTCDEIYNGRYGSSAPDIVMFPADEKDMVFGKYEFASGRVADLSFATSGKHKMNGILMARGPAVREKGVVNGARITDIFPNILYMLNQGIPDDLDGKVLKGMYKEGYMDKNMICYKKAGLSERPASGRYSGKEEESIRKRLENLGYI
ncbi:MAG: alkaline phosphatase family protein [Elusimicrobia bacterium]|nr:alkaline phosphatase family protein [Elusimicrobiota bacterium]